jgi:hypothetical protein
MFNPFDEVEWHPDSAKQRKFARSLVIGFPIVGIGLCLLEWAVTGSWRARARPGLVIGAAGAAAGLLLLAFPRWILLVYRTWFFLACCVGVVVSNLLLLLLYFVVLTPLGLLRRSLGQAPLQRRFDRGTRTYWRDVPPVTDVMRYYKQF